MKRIIKAAVCLAVTGLLVVNNGLTSTEIVHAEYDRYGYDDEGYDRNGFDKDGYDREGYDITGYDRNGYDRDGYYISGFNREGYDKEGYDVRGYNRDGYNRSGYDRTGFDREGYDNFGYDREGYNKEGRNQLGFDRAGYDKDGYTKNGFDKEGYNREGYDVNGYNKEGYNRGGYDKDGYDKNGYDVEGYGKDGYNKKGYDREGYDRDGYNQQGYNRKGYDKNGYPWNPKTPTGGLYEIIKCSDKSWTYDVDSRSEGSIDYVTAYHITCKTAKPKQVLEQINANIKKSKKLDYKILSIKPMATKKGYGQYKITIKYNKEYKEAVKTIDMTIFPFIVTRCTLNSVDGKKVLTEIVTTKDGAKFMDGVEYTLAQATTKKLSVDYDTNAPTHALKEKLFNKGSKKVGKLKFESLVESKKYIAADLFWSSVMKNGKKWIMFHNRARFYIVVNGKKIYSQYRDHYSYGNELTFDLF